MYRVMWRHIFRRLRKAEWEFFEGGHTMYVLATINRHHTERCRHTTLHNEQTGKLHVLPHVVCLAKPRGIPKIMSNPQSCRYVPYSVELQED
jgi:hypothetical protein